MGSQIPGYAEATRNRVFIVLSYETSRADTRGWSHASRREETAMTTDSETTTNHGVGGVLRAARLSYWMIFFALRSTTDLLDHPEARSA